MKKDIGKYVVYSDGKVWSKISKKFLKQTLTNSGYYILGSKLGFVHRLIVKTFIGKIPNGFEVNHKDGNKLNNDISNLEIVSKSENIRHAHRLGLVDTAKGERNGMSKLKEADIISICDMMLFGLDNESIAKRFDIHPRYVSLIRRKKRWKHVVSRYPEFPKSNKYKNK